MKGRRMKAKKRVAIPKAMEAKVGAATQLFHQCARAQLQMREAMREMRKSRNFAYTIAKELEQRYGARELVARAQEDKKEAELQRVDGDNKRLKVALEVKEAGLQRAKMELQLAPMFVCDWAIESEVEWGLGDRI